MVTGADDAPQGAPGARVSTAVVATEREVGAGPRDSGAGVTVTLADRMPCVNGAKPVTGGPAAGGGAEYPLSVAQLRWWVAQQLYPDVPNTIAMYLDMVGRMDVDLLRHCAAQAAWELQSPHVRFRLVDGQPRQYLDPNAFDVPRVEDVSERPDPVAAAAEIMERDYRLPLDLLRDRLSLATLFRVGPDHHLLYLRSHHIVLDGVGTVAVLRRTSELYAVTVDPASFGDEDAARALTAMRTGEHRAKWRTGITATARPMTVPEMLDDERAYRDSSRSRTDSEYWHEQLSGGGEVVGLAGRRAAPMPRPHRIEATLPEATALRLEAAQERSGASFPELTVAAFACYLAAMSGNEDVVLSLPVAARASAALRRSAGSVSNVVPLRLCAIRTGTVAGAVEQVRTRVIGALRHQRYRYEDMLYDRGDQQVVRGGFGPVLNALGMIEQLQLGAMTAQARLMSLGMVEDLLINGFQLGPDARAASIDMQGNPALYSAETLAWHHRTFLEYFHRFLGAEPDRVVHTLDPAPAPVAAGRPRADERRLLPDLLCANAGSDAVALSDGDRSWTYRELDQQSARWARELIDHGAGPGTVVTLAIPRSAESVLALLAVSRTGAAFAPVDPADPARFLAGVVADSGARLGLTTRAMLRGLPPEPAWLVVDDPELTARVARRSGDPVTDRDRIRPLHPDHTAYLIYTSGTTGRPKGVIVGHRGLGALTDHIVDRYRVDGFSRVLHAHAPSFDAHLLELLAAFASGAHLVVEPPAVVAGADLRRLLDAERITHFLTTPAVLATLSPEDVPGLRVAVVGGEACPAELIRKWAPALRLFNGYGPTETTVMATQSEPLIADEPAPIGAALPGVRAVVLNSRLEQVPPGGRGELYLGGPGVAHGYLGRPATTAERFVADPFGSGERLYRTGDLVLAPAAAGFTFLGRADDQLTLRGRRVEPGEVEAALTALPGVGRAVVTVDSGHGSARLVGYVVPAEPGTVLDTADLVQRLRDLLPAALVPTQLVALDRLPVTAHGKVDRAALPAPAVVLRPYRAPETELQRLVAEQFAAVTGAARVGLDDDFFDLGGDSLLGVELSAELVAATGKAVTVRWLYTAPTVAALAERIATDDGTAADDALGVVLTLRPGGTRPPLFCVHSAVPLAWCYTGLARYISDRPVYGLQALTLAGEPRSDTTIDDLAEGYVTEILRVQPEGPYHLLGWSLGGQIAHAIAVRLRRLGHPVRVLAMLDSIVFPDGMPPPPVPRMRDLLTHLLGDEPEDADALADLTAEQAAEVLATGASLGSGLSADQLTRLHRGYVDGVRLSHGYRPGTFDGDLLYFSATRGQTESLDAGLWRPYVTGRLIEHPVDATHAQLTNSDVVTVIGPLLAAHLEAEGAR
ncbi:non-ribosomal peptide synthetase [Nocardia sp. alder85J]|uniref:non-ribosomal peptide synthetase n=1 Tax=Nocardia sp. alder85J TaxID=2862949 RepID=UPI001CD78AA5|nr:non-ribosomal peptide synthetase [Nocardia sp. alder85J]MCX4092259.1 non-ribosomal peptide synthetase [Nocardia sp. alder85J]